MHWMNRTLALGSLSIIAAAGALATAPEQLGAQASAPTCFNEANCIRPPKAKLNYLCMNISDRTKDPDDDSPFVFVYERTLWEMVGARPGVDSLPAVAARVRTLWQRYHDDFICDTIGLSLGHVLTYAVFEDCFEFVRDAIETYHIDPNVYDPAVKGTVLDFVDSELVRLRRNNDGRTTPQIREFEDVRTLLVRLGVKHWSEHAG